MCRLPAPLQMILASLLHQHHNTPRRPAMHIAHRLPPQHTAAATLHNIGRSSHRPSKHPGILKKQYKIKLTV